MGDLISRKALMRKLFFAEDGRKYPTRDIDNFPTTITFEDLRKVIRNEPTSYDVDKVVEQLEEQRTCSDYGTCNHCQNRWCPMELLDADEAITIVKGGGKDE